MESTSAAAIAAAAETLQSQKHQSLPEALTTPNGDCNHGNSPNPEPVRHNVHSRSVPNHLSLAPASDSDRAASPKGSAAATPRGSITAASYDGRTSPLMRSSFSKSSEKSSSKKKSGNWFSLNYKKKSDEFHRLFKDVPSDERLLVDYSCALQKELLIQGRLYISQNWICFYANLFRWETTVMIPCHTIKSVTKEKTAKVIPNAIQINVDKEKHFFSSFTSRDKTYLMMFRVWQNALLAHPMNNQQIWQWVHKLYGSELGLTASDDDYEAPDSFAESDTAVTPDMSSTVMSDDTIGGGGNPLQSFHSPSTSSHKQQAPMTNGIDCDSLSSDCTDTTESMDEGDDLEVECQHEHTGWNSLDLVTNFSADQLFDLIFTDTPFFRGFLESQNTTDIVFGTWSEEPDEEGRKSRTNNLTIALSVSFGPKSTPSVQKQYIQAESQPGSYYCVDVENYNDPALPYGENFYVHDKYCITKVSKTKSRLTVYSEICYMKSVFFPIRSMIDKNVRNGISSFYKPLRQALAAESEKVLLATEQPRKKKRYTRHRAGSLNRVQSKALNGAIHGDTNTPRSPAMQENSDVRRSAYISSTVRVMSALLIFLVMFNMLLFFKLWSLETKHVAMTQEAQNRDLYDHQDLITLLNRQKQLYDKDIERWQNALHSSTEMIEKLQKSIEELKHGPHEASLTRSNEPHFTDSEQEDFKEEL